MKSSEILKILSRFLIEKGMWKTFLEWAQEKGYDIMDLANPE